MSAPLGLAIVGVGVAARYHAQAIARTPDARLVAVCRSDAGGAAAAAAEFGVPCETSVETLLARPDVDAVVLCTPSGLHAVQAVAAAHAGKHVLVEKPMALTLGDADAMIGACAAADVRLGVVFQRRTEPAHQALHKAVAAGDLGALVLGTVRVPYFRSPAYYASAAWRGTWAGDGGGALMNQGIHLVDLLLWLMGDVEEVHAYAATRTHAIETEDCLSATLRFTSGALGSIVATTAAAPGFPHALEVYGTRGGVQVADQAHAGATGLELTGHAHIVADFAEAVRDGRAPMVDGREGRGSLAVVLAAYESARTGRPVRVDAGSEGGTHGS
jgi:UDP-N-acetyl-2-amino-2-deoxyglucuronate dehydrogenase